jgi:hypothetical protein
VRWDSTKEASIDNLAFMGREEYDRHLKIPNLQEAGYSQDIHLRFAEKSKYAA